MPAMPANRFRADRLPMIFLSPLFSSSPVNSGVKFSQQSIAASAVNATFRKMRALSIYRIARQRQTGKHLPGNSASNTVGTRLLRTKIAEENMSDNGQLAENLTASLQLARPPIAVAFSDAAPANIPAYNGVAPAGCFFWQEAATRTFTTSSKDHA